MADESGGTVETGEARVMRRLGALSKQVDHLSKQVAAQEKRLHAVYTVVVLAVGVVGGPNVAQVVSASGH